MTLGRPRGSGLGLVWGRPIGVTAMLAAPARRGIPRSCFSRALPFPAAEVWPTSQRELEHGFIPYCIVSKGSQMTALAQALSRFAAVTNLEAETLKALAIFCGLGLLVSLIFMSYGLDLSPGFF